MFKASEVHRDFSKILNSPQPLFIWEKSLGNLGIQALTFCCSESCSLKITQNEAWVPQRADPQKIPKSTWILGINSL